MVVFGGIPFNREGSGRGRGLFRRSSGEVQEKLGFVWLRGFCVVGYGNRMVLRECRGGKRLGMVRGPYG